MDKPEEPDEEIDARDWLLARLRNQPVTDVKTGSRDELYQRERTQGPSHT